MLIGSVNQRNKALFRPFLGPSRTKDLVFYYNLTHENFNL